MIFDGIHRRLDLIQRRFDRFEARLDEFERKLDAHEEKMNGHPERRWRGLNATQWLITALIVALLAAHGVEPAWIAEIADALAGG